VDVGKREKIPRRRLLSKNDSARLPAAHLERLHGEEQQAAQGRPARIKPNMDLRAGMMQMPAG